MLTFNDVNRDVKFIISEMGNPNRPIPSTWKAVKVSAIIPVIGVFLSSVSFWLVCSIANHQDLSLSQFWTYLSSGDAIPVYMSIAIGVAQALLLLPFVSFYQSIPYDVRIATPLLLTFKKKAIIGTLYYLSILLASCVLSFKNESFLFSTPILMFIAIFFVNITINIQITKYGLGEIINRMKAKMV
ncbi:hypothetical protein L7Q45_004703 [Citrobacter braakii]|uniref:Uncharacterized protein n=1 Tax=Citrobacter braakii TaxID=57706 RepID=A0A8I0KQ49_CITBR|nr:hypothetical protein [Citrobacter braakii]EIV2910324.1 hypothetical protein [Citrobacter braakii]MBD3125870.1 hypothetical protein [Citrobacter braakii]MBJ8835424.1 hypothetical protein [Citrobacter freundii]